jgi:hypothetical protein
MRRVAGLALLLGATPALAAGDAPVELHAGQVAPVAGLLLPSSTAITAAQRLTACEARVPRLESAVESLPPWWVVPVVAVVALGVGVGLGVTLRQN